MFPFGMLLHLGCQQVRQADIPRCQLDMGESVELRGHCSAGNKNLRLSSSCMVFEPKEMDKNLAERGMRESSRFAFEDSKIKIIVEEKELAEEAKKP